MCEWRKRKQPLHLRRTANGKRSRGSRLGAIDGRGDVIIQMRTHAGGVPEPEIVLVLAVRLRVAAGLIDAAVELVRALCARPLRGLVRRRRRAFVVGRQHRRQRDRGRLREGGAQATLLDPGGGHVLYLLAPLRRDCGERCSV